MKTLITTLLILGFHLFAYAQRQVFNINKTSGLPGNHVYNMTVDHNSYLWIATPKGIVKYNGYETRIYDMSSGLPNEDIWFLRDDASGRLWLSTLSNEFGYIKNNTYHAVISTPLNELLYPRPVRQFKDGVAFLSPSYSNGKIKGSSFYLIAKDTFIKCNLGIYGTKLAQLNDKAEIICIAHGYLYKLKPTRNGLSAQRIRPYNKWFINKLRENEIWVFKNYIGGYQYKAKEVWIETIEGNGTLQKLSLPDTSELITYAYPYDNVLYINSTKNIYIIDSTLNRVATYSITSLCNNENVDVTKPCIFMQFALWGNCLATTNKGLFINYNTPNYFQKSIKYLQGYAFVGSINDTTCYWWNNSKESLLESTANCTTYYSLPGIKEIRKIIPYNNQYSILINANNVYRLDNKTKSTNSFFPDLTLNVPIDVLALNDTLYGTFSGTKGFYKHTLADNKRHGTIIDDYNYSTITYDSARHAFWLTGKQKILFYSLDKGNSIIVNKKTLAVFGIKSIESIVVDNHFGNILLKEHDKILVFNPENYTLKTLRSQYRFTESFLKLYNNTLIIVGPFGVLFSKVLGKEKFSIPVVYQNIKNTNYSSIYDIQANQKLIINTDKGVYTVEIPSDSILLRNKATIANPYKLLVENRNNITPFLSGDTIELDQRNPLLSFDVINPTGNGHLKITYKLNDKDSGWLVLPSNQLHLPDLEAGTYYKASFIAYDHVWKSKLVHVWIYPIPYWWQTNTWITLFIIAGLILITIIGILITVITKRAVLNNANKKTHLVELELKSIYSQINPHFIFNTLGTALYFIKTNRMKDAYNHINKFSRLLRTYIKSSRNRFISLEDEISNLKDYIELQQSRFIDKFSYELRVEDSISTSGVKIPSLLLQPIVENAIHHGLLNRSEPGSLFIGFDRPGKENTIICTISDDGIGRIKAKALQNASTLKHESYGSFLIDDLIQLYNKYEAVKIKIEYIDKIPPETGTIVKIIIESL